jgi:uncharacterized membrane protein
VAVPEGWADEPAGPGRRLARTLGWFGIGLGMAELVAPGRLGHLIGITGNRNRVLLRAFGLREITSGAGILARPGSPRWLGSRVAGDVLDFAMLAAALGMRGARRKRVLAATAAVLGVAAVDLYAAHRLKHRPTARLGVGEQGGMEVRKAITVNRSPDEVYRFWRDLSNLPRFMSHLQSVDVIDESRSHWVARAPAGGTVEWDAEIVDDRPNQRIAWQSLEGSEVENAGSVTFTPAPGERGTEVRVALRYLPPAGATGRAIARLFGQEPGQQIEADLRAFKQVIETGEVVHSDASIHRGPHPAQPTC